MGVPGHAKLGGRQKGTLNKFTQLKLDILKALDNIDSKKGRVEVLVELATSTSEKDREIFWRLVGKLIPTNVLVGGDGEEPVDVVHRVTDDKSMSDAYARLIRGENVVIEKDEDGRECP